VAVGDGFCEVEQLAAAALRLASEHLEGVLFVDRGGGHEDSFGAFDHRPASEGAFEAVVFGRSGAGRSRALTAAAASRRR